MKIRNGFVSNSSSSSYIVSIHGIKYKNFITHIYREYNWNYFNEQKIKEKVIERLKDNSEYKKEINEKKMDFFFSQIEKMIEKDTELLEKIDSFSDEEMVETMLKRISIKVIDKKNSVELISETTMHNDFNTGMTNLLKEIVLYFMFDTDYKVKCERIDTS